jgi:hypothetical protein
VCDEHLTAVGVRADGGEWFGLYRPDAPTSEDFQGRRGMAAFFRMPIIPRRTA